MINYKKLEETGNYELLSNYNIETGIKDGLGKIKGKLFLNEVGQLFIRKGYLWDGASGGVDTLDFMRASLVHDALYQLMRCGLIPLSCRRTADKLLRDICIQDGMPKLRAWNAYFWVRLLGRKSAKSN